MHVTVGNLRAHAPYAIACTLSRVLNSRRGTLDKKLVDLGHDGALMYFAMSDHVMEMPATQHICWRAAHIEYTWMVQIIALHV